jgi:hypothetical protein
LPKPRQIISHNIVTPLDMGKSSEITAVLLVNRLQAKEACRYTGSSCRSFALPGERRGVVRERMDGALSAVNVRDGTC